MVNVFSEAEDRFQLPATEIIEKDDLPPIQGKGIVEFRLLYQGLLRSNGSVEDKFAIRRQFHSQLRRLWIEQPLLNEMARKIGFSGEGDSPEKMFGAGLQRLADNWIRNGFRFVPLSNEHLFLRCSLDVLFLRREKPGRVFMRGDIDNRLKTLFDALQMPDQGQEIGNEVPGADEDPFFVLMQNDENIADVSVTTDRLLDFPASHQYSKDYAVLVLNVKLQPTKPVGWSWVFS